MADDQLLDVLIDVLRTGGPQTQKALVAAVRARGVHLGDDPEDALIEALEADDQPVELLADDRWAWLPALLAGRVFTHRLTAAEVEHDVLALDPDLSTPAALVPPGSGEMLTDGAAVEVVYPEFDGEVLDVRAIPDDAFGSRGLLLPAGYLRGRDFAEGAVVGLRLGPAGLELVELDEPVADGPALAHLARRLGAVLTADDQPAELDTAILTACADEPDLFARPLPPLRITLVECGLAWSDEWLAEAGFDFARWRTDRRLAGLIRDHDLSRDEALAVLATTALFDRVVDVHAAAEAAVAAGDEAGLAELVVAAQPAATGSRPDPATTGFRSTVRDAMTLLEEPVVAEAVLAETIGAGSAGAAALGLFAETVEPLAPRPARVAVRWLRAKAYERLGDITAAEQAYEAANTMDPNWSPVLVDLARFAGDRGDAERGLTLLRRAGAPEDEPAVELLRAFQPAPRADIGRNQPCWCGSGRKYKACHSRREVFPLAERAAWLYQKAGYFLRDGSSRLLVLELATERARHDESPLALLDALDDPMVADVALFEGGGFAEFLAVRGPLLPDDERLLAEQWLLVDRSVFEIRQARPGDGLTMRDVRTGDVHEVRERTASRQLRAGQLVCARVVPAGDTVQIFGGIQPVAAGPGRDELIALLDGGPDPLGLVEFLSRRYAPTRLQNTEGDPLVICEAALSCADPGGLAAALDRTYQRADEPDEPPCWYEHVVTHGMTRIRATLTWEDDRLTVTTNSEPRMDRVLETLRALGVDTSLLDDTRQPAGDIQEFSRLAERTPPSGEVLDPADPAVAEVLAEYIHQYEHSWLDQEIPALSGYTPRAAAADPTRRDDLIRLLAGFPDDPGNPALMSPGRLRSALGLE